MMPVLWFIPLLGSLVILMWPGIHGKNVHRLATVFALLPLLWSCYLLSAMGSNLLTEAYRWAPALGLEFRMQLDGIGSVFVILTGLVTPFAIACAPASIKMPRTFFALILFLQAMLFGVFTAMNFILWFFFWELTLIPAYLLIKLWGSGNHPQAALKFFLMTLGGSLLLLGTFLALFFATETFDFGTLAAIASNGNLAPLIQSAFPSLPWLGTALFLAVLIGLAVKVPMFPFHTWLPDAYTEAPSAVTILLTGLLSKMGIYGLLRIALPIFPEQMRALSSPLLWLAVATIVLSAFAALRQNDLKRIFAYSSINHLGYCLLGVFAAAAATTEPTRLVEQSAALSGVLLQVFNHGIIAGLLFCYVGFLEMRSDGLRGISDFGGLRAPAPVFAGLTGIALFASLGLPGLSGFVGEFLIFKGSFALTPAATAASTLGLLVTAIFLLKIQRKVFHGPLPAQWKGFQDLTLRERLLVAPSTALVFLLGLWPGTLLAWTNPALKSLLESLP